MLGWWTPRKGEPMSQLFVRIELRGTPSEETYTKLHAYMRSKNWSQEITGESATVMLPHATYQATFGEDQPNTLRIAKALRTYIESNIWTKAIVLVIRSADWARSGS
jgi:hypothetical protein